MTPEHYILRVDYAGLKPSTARIDALEKAYRECCEYFREQYGRDAMEHQ